MVLYSRSISPLKGSTNSPNVLPSFKRIAMAFIVKSRRFWSSCNVPSSTIGLRECALYDSFRAPTNSTSRSSSFSIAVPKFLNTASLFSNPTSLATDLANSTPLPITRISTSFDGLFRKMSRTKPPIT
ncbi:hypothetical protein D3C72_1040810 [compost metagenome]